MNTNQLLEMCGYAGKLLIENGAEIYRVEETMVRLCTSFQGVEDAESFVTPTGIMLSITVNKTTHTKILRVRNNGVDLNCIDKINELSRQAATSSFTIEELQIRLHAIADEKRYSFLPTLFFGALSAFGFALFFGGNIIVAVCSFVIGMAIKSMSWFMEHHAFNNFFTNAVSAGIGAFFALIFHALFKEAPVDIMIISSIMLLVPGLAITNAIRDTVAGDYLSGVSRGVEAVIVAVAIAAGIGFVLSMSIGISGGM